MDNLTKQQRRKNMQAIKSSGTGLEKMLGKSLWRSGLRYRKNYSKLPGKPDFVLVKHRIVVFCDSEFWHGKNWAKTKKRIKSNQGYWHTKIANNIKRDKKINKELAGSGWTVIRFWGKDIIKKPEKCAEKVKKQAAKKLSQN